MTAQRAPVPMVHGILLIAMLVWGLNLPAVKVLTQWFDPMMLACVRMVVACIALTGMLLWKRCPFASLAALPFAAICACALLMVYLNQILFAEGLLRSTATNAALIMAFSPLFSAVLASVAFGEKLTRRRIAGVAMGFVGVALVVLSHPGAALSSAGLGDMMLVAGVVCFASGGAVVQRLARSVHPFVISWAIYCVGTLFLLVHTAVGDPPSSAAEIFPGWWPWALVLFSGVFATAAANVAWNGAIARIGVARTAVFLYWVPIFGVASSAVFLGEAVTLWHLAGFIAVMAGTYLGTHVPASARAT